MNKSLHAALMQIYISRGDQQRFHICYNSVVVVETYYALPHCAHIHCLVSINIQQALMNVNSAIFFSA